MAADESPNAQVLLANERTFLSWIRTALALVATGVALVAFNVPMPERLRLVSSSIFILLGIAATVQAWIGWRATDAAARGGEPIPPPVTRTLMIAGVIVATAIVGVGLVVGVE
jgi:putative membrane protein